MGRASLAVAPGLRRSASKRKREQLLQLEELNDELNGECNPECNPIHATPLQRRGGGYALLVPARPRTVATNSRMRLPASRTKVAPQLALLCAWIDWVHILLSNVEPCRIERCDVPDDRRVLER